MDTLDTLFERLWSDYISLNPQAKEIYDLLESQNETIINDHIALRTYVDSRVCKEKLAQSFLDCGYHRVESYDFIAKRLNAFHLEHSDPDKPKVFISELRTHELTYEAQEIIINAVNEIDPAKLDDFYLSSAGRLWTANYQDYQLLLNESEYAAWVYAFGFRVNHFTVFINALNNWDSLYDFNEFIKANGFKLNSAGGEVKGSPDAYLEQSSTMANEVDVEFSDGIYKIPYCFYEFAKRYRKENGEYFHGFVACQANKLFESTNVNS